MKFESSSRTLRSLKTAVAVTLFTAAVAHAGLNHWTSAGPFGGHINQIAAAPDSPGTLYAATSNGVFKTTDGGESWTIVFPSPRPVEAIAVGPSDRGFIVAGFSTGSIARSTDAGATWTEIPVVSHSVESISIDPFSPSVVYLTAILDGILKSTDAGCSWQRMNHGIPTNPEREVDFLVFSPDVPNSLIAATGFNGLFKSTDGGANWAEMNDGLSPQGFLFGIPLYAVRALSIDPSNPQRMFAALGSAGSDDFFPGGAVFRSDDGGASWNPVDTGFSANYFGDVAIDPSAPNTIYVGAVGTGLLKSTDNGQSWGLVGNGLNDQFERSLIVVPSDPATLYALDPDFARSDDGGAAWTAKDDDLAAVGSGSIAVAPSDGSVIYSGSIGVQKSADGGESWRDLETPNSLGASSITIDRVNPNIAYAASNGVLKTTDGGTHWSLSTNGLDSPIGALSAIVIDPIDSQTLLLAGSRGVFRSSDGGDNWGKIDTVSSYALWIDPLAPSTIYAGGLGVRKSVDGGDTWNDASTGLTAVSVFALAAPPGSNGTLFAAANDGIYDTTDGGDHWSLVTSFGALTLTVTFDPTNPQVAYAGTDGFGSSVSGVYRSTDGGSTWQPFSDGLDSFGSRRIHGLATDASGTRLFAATEAGVFALERSAVSPPQIVSVFPSSGPAAGGTSITILGSGFQPGAVVLVGGAAAGAVNVTDSQITATTPAGTAGGADLEIVNPDGQPATALGAFAFDFDDVPPSALFHDAVIALSQRQITRGCGNDAFCPNGLLSRIQAATLIERATHGTDFDYPIVTSIFTDVTVCDPLALYVAQFAVDSLTNGCAPGKFCPLKAATREQMATFIARAKSPGGIPTQGDVDGVGYDCEPGGTSLFRDVAPGDPFCAPIHEIASMHITFGCGGGKFCPTDPVPRWEAALFLARASLWQQ